MRTARQHARLLSLGLVAVLAALSLAPFLVPARALRPPTRDLATAGPSFWSPARTLYPVSAPPLPWPWGPPCDARLEGACDF